MEGELVNGQPVWRHTKDSTRWIAYDGQGKWWGQLEANRGESAEVITARTERKLINAGKRPKLSTAQKRAAHKAAARVEREAKHRKMRAELVNAKREP